MTWATSVPILVFLGLSVLDLGPMYATNVRQTDIRQHHCLMPPPYVDRGIISQLNKNQNSSSGDGGSRTSSSSSAVILLLAVENCPCYHCNYRQLCRCVYTLLGCGCQRADAEESDVSSPSRVIVDSGRRVFVLISVRKGTQPLNFAQTLLIR